MIYPQSLAEGDTIRIIAPAGKIAPEVVDKAADTLTGWGFKVELSNHLFDGFGRYSATRECRLADLTDALNDDLVKAILCARGGYGAVHLLDGLDSSFICSHPKWLIGYSDVTLLHAFFNRAGIASLHAPMCKHLGEYPLDEASQMMHRILKGERPSYRIPVHSLNRLGQASGRLVGGNLAVFNALHGTPFDFDYSDAILFIEDIGESPYKIERMIYSLRLSGIFNQISGLIVGSFTDCEEDPQMKASIYENISQLVSPYPFPVCFGFPCGHVPGNLPLIEGVEVTLSVKETAVELKVK